MGRPEPCVLFAQTFVHSQLDEYVDEVFFNEPVVVTACEFLEQNASSASQVVPLVGATSPLSFALEVFVQSAGETRFRRLCQPFLYSHSSANVLEVEAVVTNHLVVRGCYRSLSLVIYGNTAEDLGQFNIEFDDNSLTNLVCSTEGKLEELPLALHSANRAIEESLTSLKVLSLPIVVSDISVEVKQFLQLVSKVLELPNIEDSLHKVLNIVATAVCSYATHDQYYQEVDQKNHKVATSHDSEDLHDGVVEARKKLVEVLQSLGDESTVAECSFLESENDMPTSKQLVDIFIPYLCVNDNGQDRLKQKKNMILGLSVALLLCSGRESCFHFVNGGGMGKLVHVFSCDVQNSSAVMLLLLGVIDQASRYPIGCEGFLGWWPREDENIPSGTSEGYGQLLRLVLQNPRHDIASIATYVLHRLRLYEVASRYETAVLSVLSGLSATGKVSTVSADMLTSAKLQLKTLLKLINSRGPIEDPSPVARARKLLILAQTEGILSYKTTCNLIGSSSCSFSNWDIDPHLLSLLQERGFLPLSAALLSSPILHKETGDNKDTFIDTASSIGAVLFSLLVCRSGLIFLLQQPELSAILIDALRGTGNMNKEECAPLRYASMLLSKGFVCSPQEVGMIAEMHLRVVNAIDRLLVATPHSEEFLWVLWELCGLSRSYCGRQAILVIRCFPEAVSVLIEALHSVKETEPLAKSGGASPINLAIFHSAAEIFEIIVTDSTASSLNCWVEHAKELHKALHSSSPGSNRKDAPTRLLEWIDAGLVYQKNGAIGLLRYSAVLASGGDAHLTSTSILVSDLTDVENIVGDASGGSDINVMDNLGKIISEKTFDGVILRDSAVVQLTTAIRILAFISENATVAAALYDEGAITVIYAILVNCSFMLERSSNNYDYLVDEGTECNATSDLLLERNREQNLVDVLVPSMVLLINILQKLQEAKEQHRNTKLMNALLRLHRDVSPKLAACSADLSSPYPDSALGFGAVCHLIVSALTCWPVYGWTPGLFHSLIANVQAASLLSLGPKEICSLLCFLNDILPEEGICLWKNGMPLLSALRMLAVGTLLGPQKERQVNWYLESSHLEKLHSQLTLQLDKIAQIIQHYAISALVVIQDLLRVFIVRVACQRTESASKLLRPIFSCIHDHITDVSPSDVDAYKVYRYLDFLAGVLEHPGAKTVLLQVGLFEILTKVLERCFSAIGTDKIQSPDIKVSANHGFTLSSWCLPAFKSFALLCDSRTYSAYYRGNDSYRPAALSTKDCALILQYLFKFMQVLPVGKELVSCLASFKELASCSEGQSALITSWNKVFGSMEDSETENGQEKNGNCNLDMKWKKHPLLCCWMKLLRSVDTGDNLLTLVIEAVNTLSAGSLSFCMDGRSLNMNAVEAIKGLHGLRDAMDQPDDTPENASPINKLSVLLSAKITDVEYMATLKLDMQSILCQASELSKALLSLLQKPDSVVLDDILCSVNATLSPVDVLTTKRNQMADRCLAKPDDCLCLGGLSEMFLWECPETMPDRLSQNILIKRKGSSLDTVGKRVKGENSTTEVAGQNAFTRGLGPSTTSSGPSRRDTFRQRKPNTSRPPSMHVDDYVARERSIDGTGNSNVIAVQRIGSSGGRPPSIHVDEFMARQRERQNPIVAVVGEASVPAKNAALTIDAEKDKVNKSKQLKTDLDDDLQGIDIVFDGEESEPDDKLPFPQLDDNLQPPAPVVVEESSPHSIVEETESDVNSQYPLMGTPLGSHNDDNGQSEYSSRMSMSRPEMPLTREPSVSSDKRFYEQSDDSRNVGPVKNSAGFDSLPAANASGFSASVYNNAPVSSMQSPLDSRMTPQNIYANSPQHVTGSRGFYDQKVVSNQPPLPPMPPPAVIPLTVSQNPDLGASFSSQFVSSVAESDSKYSRISNSPSGSAGPHPPLPPTPPPFSSSPYNFPPMKSSSQLSGYNIGAAELPQTSISPINDPRLGNISASGAGLSSYQPPPLMPPLVFSRPATIPVNLYGGNLPQQPGENPNIMQHLSIPSMQQLQPLQPPLQRPPQPPQNLWPPLQSSQPLEQAASLQSPMQMQQLQMMQQHQQISPMQTHYQGQQQEPSHSRLQQFEHTQQQAPRQQGDAASQSQQDVSLQEYFKDPKAIASLLSNKEELCRLLEQHPKLMQMLQEKLGQ